MKFQVLRCRYLKSWDRFQIWNFYPKKFKIETEFCNFKFWGADFSLFGNPNNLFQNGNFKFWQNRILHFDLISTQNFNFWGSIYQISHRISLNTRKFCAPNFSSTHQLAQVHVSYFLSSLTKQQIKTFLRRTYPKDVARDFAYLI